MPLFAVSLNTRRDLLVFFFLSRVALIPAQLTGFFCAKDSTFPFSRVRQNSCREIVDSHAVSMDRGEQHLNHTHLERLWTVLQPLAKAAIVFYLCTRMWGRPLDPQKNTDKICGGWILGAQIIGLCNLKKWSCFSSWNWIWDYWLNIILTAEDDNIANRILLYMGIWAWNWNMDSVPVGDTHSDNQRDTTVQALLLAIVAGWRVILHTVIAEDSLNGVLP